MDFRKLTALELSEKIKKREVSAVEVTKAQIEYIKLKDQVYNSFITLLEDEGLKQAAQVQDRIDKGELDSSPLAGVPMAIKDNICTKDIRTTCASKMLENFIPSYNARVVEKLEAGGAIILGKLNMDEFAMGSSSETSYFGTTKNPINTQYVPGGSSGGSAAAVASDEVFYSLGSDTGGSIRQPCSFCGLVGIKPTYGTVSRHGLVGLASSFDQIGPMTKDVSDAVAVLDIIKGYDPKDSTSVNRKYDSYSKDLVDDVKGMKIAIPKEFLTTPMDEQVKVKFRQAVEIFKNKGALVDFIDLKTSDYLSPTYYILSSAEASSNMARIDGIRYGYRPKDAENIEEIYRKSRGQGLGEEVKLRVLLGNYVLSGDNYETYYNKALKVRRIIANEYEAIFSNYDIVLGPTTLSTAFKLKEFEQEPVQKSSDTDNKMASKKITSNFITLLANIVGLPAISIPCGLDDKGLPIGLQMMGRRFGESDIIRAAYSYEVSENKKNRP